MGGFDLFLSAWDAQAELLTKAQNLGFPVNTPGDNKNIAFFDDGRHAFISALREDSYGDLDIYEIIYNDWDEKQPALFLFNVATDLKGQLPTLEIRDEYDEPVGKYDVNDLTARYTVGLYPGKYFVYLDADGFKPYTEVLIVNKFHRRQQQNLRLINLD